MRLHLYVCSEIVRVAHDLAVPQELGIGDLPGVILDSFGAAHDVIEPVGGVQLEPELHALA